MSIQAHRELGLLWAEPSGRTCRHGVQRSRVHMNDHSFVAPANCKRCTRKRRRMQEIYSVAAASVDRNLAAARRYLEAEARARRTGEEFWDL